MEREKVGRESQRHRDLNGRAERDRSRDTTFQSYTDDDNRKNFFFLFFHIFYFRINTVRCSKRLAVIKDEYCWEFMHFSLKEARGNYKTQRTGRY